MAVALEAERQPTPRARTAGAFALGAAALAVAWYAYRIVLITFIGVLFAVLIDWAASIGERRLRMRRSIAVITSGVLFLTIVAGTGVLLGLPLGEQVTRFFDVLPEKTEGFMQGYERFRREHPWTAQIIPDPSQGSGASAGSVARSALTGAWAVLDGFTAAVSVFFIGLFLAWDPARYLRGAAWVWRGAPVEQRVRVLRKMGEALRAYLLTLGIQIVVMAVLWFIGLWAIGIDYALLFGAIGGLVEIVPYVGPMLGLIPPLALSATEGPREVGLVVGLYAILHVIEGYILVPWLMNKQVHLPPPLVLVAILLFGTLFGFLGIVVAVPLGTVIYVWALESNLGRKPEVETIEVERRRAA